MTRTHLVPRNTMTSAFATALGTNLFTYNLLDGSDDSVGGKIVHTVGILDLHSKGFKDRLLGKIAFACDAYIGITLQNQLRKHKDDQEMAGTAPWDSYQAFRNYVAGLATSEAVMLEAGMMVKDTREQLQQLFNMRTACHDAIACIRQAMPMDARLAGSKKDATIYAVPNLEDFFTNPRLRKDNDETSRKKANVIKNLASNDEGVIDVELLDALSRSLEAKTRSKQMRDLEFDRQRGELTAMLWRAFNLTEMAPVRIYEEGPVHALRVDDETVKLDAQEAVARSMNRTDEVSPVDPFGDLDAEFQYKLLHGVADRYVKNTLLDGADDWNIDFEEHAKWTIEARPLVKAVKAALEHPKFADIGV